MQIENVARCQAMTHAAWKTLIKRGSIGTC
jgi:hypothetical protein